MPQRDWTLVDFEYGNDLVVARYEWPGQGPDDAYKFETFELPAELVPALIAILLARIDQNQRTDILRAEVAANDKVVGARHSAIGRHATLVPDWLPLHLRDGGTLR
ncbi:hypothetical protein [Embleya sp. NPDC059237]|uniref:hypothetical protein n=1 Tax=Embleya sp. NPDC059237 TaxID=3346784 RepID=UPI0036AADFF7